VRVRAWLERVGLLRGYLCLMGVGTMTLGMLLTWLPAHEVSGASYAVVFHIAPREVWGFVFIVVGVVALWGVARRSRQSARLAIVSLLGLQATWSLGLAAPIVLRGTANALAPVTWLMLLATSVFVFWYSGGDARRTRW